MCTCDAASCHLSLLYIVYTSAVGVFHANRGGPDKDSTSSKYNLFIKFLFAKI